MRPTRANPATTWFDLLRRGVSTVAVVLGLLMGIAAVRGAGRWAALAPGGRVAVVELFLFGAGLMSVALGIHHRLRYTPWLAIPLTVLWFILQGYGGARLIASGNASQIDVLVLALEALGYLLIVGFVVVRRGEFVTGLFDAPLPHTPHDA